MSILEVLRIILGLVFVVFVPGFVWGFIFFKKKNIDLLERIVLSFILSLVLVPLTLYVAQAAWIKISTVNLLLEISSLIFIGILISIGKYFYVTRLKNKGNDNTETKNNNE